MGGLGLGNRSARSKNYPTKKCLACGYEIWERYMEGDMCASEFQCNARSVRRKVRDWDTYWLNMTEQVAERATCPRLHVGAIVVRKNVALSMGYNGAPHGEEHCEDVGCCIEYGHCVRTIHAEMNALLHARTDLQDAKLYCNYKPCNFCSRHIRQVGIKEVMWKYEYP